MGFRGDYSFLCQGLGVVFVLIFVSVMFRDGFFSILYHWKDYSVSGCSCAVFFLC